MVYTVFEQHLAKISRKMRCVLILAFLLTTAHSHGQSTSSEKVEVLLLGTLHFNQFHKPDKVSTDFLGKTRQGEFQKVVHALAQFRPDEVYVEREPAGQQTLDSLYQLPMNELLNRKDGRSEVYQIGFKLAKQLGLSGVYGVDHYESIPQNLLVSGKRIERFNGALKEFRNIGRGITQRFLNGEMTITAFLAELNKEENINLSHRLFYNTPAYVQHGNFSTMDNLKNEIDTTYIGAEYISLFYERNLKIYSNILNQQLRSNSKRIVIIIGQVHVGVLRDIIKNNPKYTIIPAADFLK
ncbi:MAG: DUF5694 domain-containing protein [Bacteroidota bacterium]